MENKQEPFAVEISSDSTETDWEELQQFLDEIQKKNQDYIQFLSLELGVSQECAADVWYLRTRSRHTPELEQELIRLHKEGNPPEYIGDWPSKEN